MADRVRYDLHAQFVDEDQGGHWECWGYAMSGPGNAACRAIPGTSVTHMNLRTAAAEALECLIRHAEPSDLDRLRRRNAELEQGNAELASELRYIEQANARWQAEVARLQTGIGRLDP